jgi:hypothetical protein
MPGWRESAHPRCEMRELKKGTEEPAAWSTADGKVHNFSTTLAFTRVPEDGSPVTAVSVWGESGEVLAVRHEKGKVVLSRVGMEPFLLEESYVVGTPFEFMILLDKGRVRLLRDTHQIAEWPLEAEGLHFRVGVVYEAEAPGKRRCPSRPPRSRSGNSTSPTSERGGAPGS